MNKRRIADLAQEWNEVIERLNYDDFQAWFHLLPEKERLIVAEQLVAAIIYFCRDYLTVPQDEPIWEMEETMEEFEMNQEPIRVLVVEPQKYPYEKEIVPGLESLQREVGGTIEAITPFLEPVAIVLDEEGKLKGKPRNRVLRDEDGAIYDFLSGTFLVVGLGDENFISLTPELMEQFSRIYHTPEMFLNLGGAIIVLPMEPKEQEISVYPHTARYAAEHGELALYQESARQNLACTKAIEQAIQDHYVGYRLDPAGAKDVMSRFGKERVQFILALTIQHKQGDGRISPRNKEWASKIMTQGSELYQDNAQFAVNQAHPGLIDLFTSQTRTIIAQQNLAKQKNQERER